jgi:hypothetical protein
VLLLISVLLMTETDLAIVSYGRRVAELGVMGLDDSGGGGFPPTTGLLLQAGISCTAASGRRLQRRRGYGGSEMKCIAFGILVPPLFLFQSTGGDGDFARISCKIQREFFLSSFTFT